MFLRQHRFKPVELEECDPDKSCRPLVFVYKWMVLCYHNAYSADMRNKDGGDDSCMGSLCLVRRATLAHAPIIAHILLCAFEPYRPLYTEGGFAATTPTADIVAQRFDEGPAWLACEGDDAVGTVSAVVRGEQLYVRSMAVLPSARGRGVGSALLRTVEDYAAQQNVRSMYLSTTPFLDHAIRLYQNFGFRRTEQGPQELFGTPLFTMEKELSRT
jgi:GNAT superfamily N-acetyltransferase